MQAEEKGKEHRVITVTSKSSILPEDPERRIPRGYCRGLGPRGPSFRYMMGLKPKPRTKGVGERVIVVKRAHVGKGRSQWRS